MIMNRGWFTNNNIMSFADRKCAVMSSALESMPKHIRPHSWLQESLELFFLFFFFSKSKSKCLDTDTGCVFTFWMCPWKRIDMTV